MCRFQQSCDKTESTITSQGVEIVQVLRGSGPDRIRGALAALVIFSLSACAGNPLESFTEPVAQPTPVEAPAIQTAAVPASTSAAPAERGSDLKITDLYRQAIGGVFTVRMPQRTGTAFAITPTLLLTNRHVVDGASQVDLTKGGQPVQTATVVKVFSGTLDLAVLRLDRPIGGMLPLGREAPPVGEEILIIGSPRGLEGSLTRGLVSQHRTVENIPLLQIDAAVNPGNSGSPVFDRAGNVIGIVFLGGDKAMGVSGINFAISAEAIRGALASDPRLAAETGMARVVAAR